LVQDVPSRRDRVYTGPDRGETLAEPDDDDDDEDEWEES
jgi:hypothetical protein